MALRFLGTGSYLPDRVITNDFLSQIVDTNDEWISSRTGIRERRISEGEGTVFMASQAAKKALEMSNISVLDIDLIIVATLSGDNCVPAAACEVQAELGAVNAVCFDLNSACTGFVLALNTAYAYMKAGMCKNALLIGAETLSKLIDWTDRTTCVLFGDGAGAAVVSFDREEQLYETIMGADGKQSTALVCPNRGVKNPVFQDNGSAGYIKMGGQEIFRFSTRDVPDKIEELLDRRKIDKDEIKYFVFHQANQRIIISASKRLNVNIDKFPMNLDRYGNTSSASIPILLDEMNRKGMLAQGDKIVIAGFGGGLTWGLTLLEW